MNPGTRSDTHTRKHPGTTSVKICLLFTHGVSLQTWAQTGMMAREIKPYLELAKSGVAEVSFLTYGGSEDLAFQTALHPIKILPAFTNKKSTQSTLGLLFGGITALFRHRKSLRTTEIFKSNQMLGSHIAWLAAKIFRGTFLLRTGYEFYDFTRKRNIGRPRVLAAWLISYFGYKTADKIIVATPADATMAIRVFGANSDKVSIQPNWIDTNHFAPIVTDKSGQRDFLTVVRLDPQKNLPAVIRATKMANASLDILGAGPMQDELLALAHSNDADVAFLDRVPNDHLPTLIQQYRGFVLCSHFEGNPKALLEAMSCAMPVIGTAVPGIKNLIDNGIDGFLCAEDAPAISLAMTTLLGDPANAAHMGENARRRIVVNNSLSHFLNAEENHYKALTAKN